MIQGDLLAANSKTVKRIRAWQYVETRQGEGARGNAMDELLTHAWDMLIGREHGPLAFRLVLQPMVAALLAIRAGVRDTKAGRPPHGWAIATDPVRRRELLAESWHDVARLFLAAVIIDELIVFRWIYFGQALIVAFAVALPSYMLLRGPANRGLPGAGSLHRDSRSLAMAVDAGVKAAPAGCSRPRNSSLTRRDWTEVQGIRGNKMQNVICKFAHSSGPLGAGPTGYEPVPRPL
jgi:hypothetical protein